jgi:hypothetical protein
MQQKLSVQILLSLFALIQGTNCIGIYANHWELMKKSVGSDGS